MAYLSLNHVSNLKNVMLKRYSRREHRVLRGLLYKYLFFVWLRVSRGKFFFLSVSSVSSVAYFD